MKNEDINTFDCLLEYIDGYMMIQCFNGSRENQGQFFLEKILDYTKDLVFYKNNELKYQYVNQSFADFVKLDKDEILNKTDEDLLPPELALQCAASEQAALKHGESVGFEDFNGIVFKVSKTEIKGGILGVAKDVTNEHRISRLAYLDELTKLSNRRKFLEDIDEIYKAKDNNYYLALIDLDKLRDLNNNFGHKTGDLYLETLGKLLAIQPIGQFYRLAGDEFVALFKESKEVIIEQLTSLYEQISELDLNPKLTISTGIKKLELNLTFEENYELTDQLLYQAKDNGRNNFRIE